MAAAAAAQSTYSKMIDILTAAEEDGMEEEEEDEDVQVGATYSCRRTDGSYHDAKVLKTRMNKKTGRKEFYVHYVGLNRKKNQWVEKPCLVLTEAVKEEDAANEEDPEASKTTSQKQGDAEPKAKKAKKEVTKTPTFNQLVGAEHVAKNLAAPANRKMASGKITESFKPGISKQLVNSDNIAKDLRCPLCKAMVKDPVVVTCGHNFCRHCLDNAWKNKNTFTCPDCNEVMTKKASTMTQAPANLVKTAGAITTLPLAKPVQRRKSKVFTNCPEHDEKVKLFCWTDGALSCTICRDSLKHAGHRFLPVSDACEMYRIKLSIIVTPLEAALKVAQQLHNQQTETIQQRRTALEECEQCILEEFEQLHDFLQVQEEKLVTALRKQGSDLMEEMQASASKIQRNKDFLTEAVAVANEKINETEALSFLTDIKSFIEECEEQQKDSLSSGNTVVDKELDLIPFKGPNQFNAWKEMKSLVAPDMKFSELEKDDVSTGASETDIKIAELEKKDASTGVIETDLKFPELEKDDAATGVVETGMKILELDKVDAATGAAETDVQKDDLEQEAIPMELSDSDTDATYELGDFASSAPEECKTENMPFPTTIPMSGNKQILILGNALISKAEEQAKTAYYGHDLGFGQEKYSVHWASSKDIGWDSLLPELRSKVAVMGVPSILVIHVGEDDLASMSNSLGLKLIIRRVFREVRAQYKDTTILWSCMLPRPEWCSTERCATPYEKSWRDYNQVIMGCLLHHRYKVIPHVKVEKMFSERCKNKTKIKVQGFSAIELDTFCMDIRNAIRGVLREAE
ncbi:nuclear factor 7, ovary-like isoform X2 [Hyperolius riggenbachi]|uniref:nuclear factor 7, ovary-like isoform X2 n=1 Tax=Hyperolius riggenbachi TaxID=752182 RepID=UPI0035A2A64D